MQGKHLYEYAVIRIVPRVDREEFINAGVILFCKKSRFIRMIFEVNHQKLAVLSHDIDVEQLDANLMAFQNISHGNKNAGPIALFETAERFRWLTAIRSSVIQTSRPHPGFCDDLEIAAKRLFEDLVL